MTALVIFGFAIAGLAPLAAKVTSLADLLPLVTAGCLAALAGVIFRCAGLRLEPAAPGEILGMVHNVPQPQPVLALIPPTRARSLAIRRPAAALLRPERGALAILSMAVALALFMALVPAPAPVGPPPPTVEW